MSRVVWKGAISFGLVHIPVALRTGARANDLDFDWLDKRDMARIGYSRINKHTGAPVTSDDIVKGYQYEKGEYVLLSPEDFRQANVAATQTVEIIAFVDAKEISPIWFETPYYLEPDRRGDKGYALLRAVLHRTGRAGLATVVMHSKQHLAALLAINRVLVLNTMRFADEVLPTDDLKLPGDDLDALGIGKRELDMAQRLVEDMAEPWQVERFHDSYRDDLMARIEEKIAAGETHMLTEAGEKVPERADAQVIDLASLLKESIEKRTRDVAAKRPARLAEPAPAKAAAAGENKPRTRKRG